MIEFIQTCVNGQTPLLIGYENSKTRPLGVKLRREIIKSGHFTKFDLFEDSCVYCESFRFEDKFYAVVTHSIINHIFAVK